MDIDIKKYSIFQNKGIDYFKTLIMGYELCEKSPTSNKLVIVKFSRIYPFHAHLNPNYTRKL